MDARSGDGGWVESLVMFHFGDQSRVHQWNPKKQHSDGMLESTY